MYAKRPALVEPMWTGDLHDPEVWRYRAEELRAKAEAYGDPVAFRTLIAAADSCERQARWLEWQLERKAKL